MIRRLKYQIQDFQEQFDKTKSMTYKNGIDSRQKAIEYLKTFPRNKKTNLIELGKRFGFGYYLDKGYKQKGI